MMTLTKKQVKGILNILKQRHLDTKLVLKQVYITGVDDNRGESKMYITDGYVAIEMDGSPFADPMSISYNDLERWYKLAKASEELVLADVVNKTDDRYPDLERIFEKDTSEKKLGAINTELFKKAGDVLGEDLEMEEQNSRVILKNRNGRAIIMKQEHTN